MEEKPHGSTELPRSSRPGLRDTAARGVLLVALALVIHLALARDGRQHWHEWRHVYSAAHYSVSELALGRFDPGPPPERSAEETGAWYWGQLGHEAVLRAAISVLGPGLGTATLLQLAYGIWVPLSAIGFYFALKRVDSRGGAALVSVAFLLSPLAVYCGFKMMGEVLALPFAAVSTLLLVKASESRGRTTAWWVVGLAMALAATFLAKVFAPLLPLGFAIALVWTDPLGCGRRRILLVMGAASCLAALVVALALAAWGIAPWRIIHVYTFFRDFRHPFAISLSGILVAGSLLYLLVPLALKSKRVRLARFLLVWLAASAIPWFLLAPNFIEARYLSVAAVPFAGLAALGLEALVSERRRILFPAALGSVFAGATLLALPFLPYEMRSGDLAKALQRIWENDPETHVLLPWNYSDFHFAAFAFPERPVFLVQSPVDDERRPYRDPAWESRLRSYYGPAFLPTLDDLERLGNVPFLYVGHGMLPPFQNAQRVADWLNLGFVSNMIERVSPRRHIEESWMWTADAIQLEARARSGAYYVYDVRIARQ